MIALALLTAATAQSLPAAPPTPVVVRQARATVTVISAPRIEFARIERDSPQLLRDTTIRSTDGSTQPARLVEFQ